VLAIKQYADEHIPGAINIPLLHMNASSVAILETSSANVMALEMLACYSQT
jgi:rhodanese-related sulfurtransferase